MRSGASRQTYIGNVIIPANYMEKGDRKFFNFFIYVDNLAQAQGSKDRKSARISCTYTLPSNRDYDDVSVILSRISAKDEETPSKGLNGQTYKRVSVLVEGDERLVEVADKPYAFYKNLDNCRVVILDRELVRNYLQEFGGARNSNSSEESSESKESYTTTERPSVAPESKKPITKTYQVGDVVIHGDKSYEYIGGEVSSLDSWKEVLDEPVEEEEPKLPFATSSTSKKAVQQSTAKKSNPIEDLLNEDDSDAPNFKRNTFAA